MLLCIGAICVVWLQFFAIRQAEELFVEAAGAYSGPYPRDVAWVSWVRSCNLRLAVGTCLGLLASQVMLKHVFIKGAICVACILGWGLLTNGVLNAFISIAFRVPG